MRGREADEAFHICMEHKTLFEVYMKCDDHSKHAEQQKNYSAQVCYAKAVKLGS